jgi:hypothetical protein
MVLGASSVKNPKQRHHGDVIFDSGMNVATHRRDVHRPKWNTADSALLTYFSTAW